MYPTITGFAVHPRNVMQRLHADIFFRHKLLQPAERSYDIGENIDNLIKQNHGRFYHQKGIESMSSKANQMKQDTHGAFIPG